MRLLLPFLKIGETFAFFQFVNWTPSLKLKFITAVMESAKTSAHSLRTNVGRLKITNHLLRHMYLPKKAVVRFISPLRII